MTDKRSSAAAADPASERTRLAIALEAAAADPASERARLAVAAALEAAGDPLGGAVHLEIERRADDRAHGRREPSRGTSTALAGWRARLPELAFIPERRLHLVGGLIGHVQLRWADLARPEAWWQRAPIQHLELDGPRAPGDLARLAALPICAQLESLSLSNAKLTDDDAAALAAISMPALRWIDLEDNAIGPAGMAALVAGTRWPRLAITQLDGNAATAGEVALYDADLGGADAVDRSRGGGAGIDDFGNAPGDYVRDRALSPDAAELAARHGWRTWTRVLWRSRRELPERTCVWPALVDAALDGADCRDASFLAAELSGLRAPRSRWQAASFAAAQVEDCDFTAADLTWVNAALAHVSRCRFRGAVLATAALDGARVRDCDFAEADLRATTLGAAEITDTSFRGARLGALDRTLHAHRTYRTRFVRCDFRGADFAGRELDGTQFIDCAFAGATGAPRWRGPVAIERPDFSPAGDRSDVRDAAALERLWEKP